jgi:hypothetical protein
MGKKYSLEDFEKDLLLSNVFSDSAKNLKSFERLHKDEAIEVNLDPEAILNSGLKERSLVEAKKIKLIPNKPKEKKDNTFFKRVVLAAEIASNLHNEPTFGHVKFQKLVFLAEKVSIMNLTHRYEKQAAGPYDRRFMHSIDKELQRLKWFEVTIDKSNQISKYNYQPLENLEKSKTYFNNYFGHQMDQIYWLIETFRKAKTSNVELVATIFASLEECLAEKKIISEKLIIQKVYAWSKEKAKFSEQQIIAAMKWMRENNLVPTN